MKSPVLEVTSSKLQNVQFSKREYEVSKIHCNCCFDFFKTEKKVTFTVKGQKKELQSDGKSHYSERVEAMQD